MKKLVVYYSFEGNTKFIAETIAEEIGADTLELKPEKELTTHGFMKYVWGGKQVLMKEEPALKPLDKDPQEYDVLLTGTPVWSFNYTPPLRSFFSQVRLQNKKIALFCIHNGAKGKTLENMKRELAGNDIVGEMEFIEPLRNKEENAEKAREWTKEVLSDII